MPIKPKHPMIAHCLKCRRSFLYYPKSDVINVPCFCDKCLMRGKIRKIQINTLKSILTIHHEGNHYVKKFRTFYQ